MYHINIDIGEPKQLLPKRLAYGFLKILFNL